MASSTFRQGKRVVSDVVVAELETTLIKGKRRMVEPTIFMTMDVPTNPVFCPVLPLISLAFAEDPADLFRLELKTLIRII